MSLVDELKSWYEDENYPPDTNDIDGLAQLEYQRLGSLRWGEQIRVIYNMRDEYAAVEDVEPATEMQDWGDYGEPEIYAVRPVEKEIIVTEYVKESS